MELWLALGKLIFCSISHFFYEDGAITIVYEELFTRKFGLQSDGPIMSDSTHSSESIQFVKMVTKIAAVKDCMSRQWVSHLSGLWKWNKEIQL